MKSCTYCGCVNTNKARRCRGCRTPFGELEPVELLPSDEPSRGGTALAAEKEASPPHVVGTARRKWSRYRRTFIWTFLAALVPQLIVYCLYLSFGTDKATSGITPFGDIWLGFYLP